MQLNAMIILVLSINYTNGGYCPHLKSLMHQLSVRVHQA